jgi:flagellar assembly protein FliH
VEEGRQAAIQAVEAAQKTRLEQQLQQSLVAMRTAAEKIEQSRHAWQQHWETHAVQLALAVANRLCRRELSQQPAITLEWVREALELAAGNGAITLRLNPADHALLAGQIDKVRKSLATLGTVEIVADPAITAGGCRAETEFGSLDQQLEAQLARLAEELLD